MTSFRNLPVCGSANPEQKMATCRLWEGHAGYHSSGGRMWEQDPHTAMIRESLAKCLRRLAPLYEKKVKDKIKVLVVDDDLSVCRVLAMSLRSMGFDVDAVTHFCPPSMDTDFAILDWNPSGAEMRKECIRCDVPYLIFTGDTSEVISDLEGAAGEVIIEKPCSAEELAKEIRKAVRQ